MIRHSCLLAFTLLLSPGCALWEHFELVRANSIPTLDAQTEKSKTVWVVNHGWHTGLILKPHDIRPGVFPEASESSNEWVELGWGDEGFYRAERITAKLVAKAMLIPTPSVLHLAGFDSSVEETFISSDLVKLQVSKDEFDRMCVFMSETFKRDQSGASLVLGPGLYGNSRFYRANGNYYAPKTCNVWTAKALKRAGFKISPQLATTAEGVLLQIRRQGSVIPRRVTGETSAPLGWVD